MRRILFINQYDVKVIDPSSGRELKIMVYARWTVFQRWQRMYLQDQSKDILRLIAVLKEIEQAYRDRMLDPS